MRRFSFINDSSSMGKDDHGNNKRKPWFKRKMLKRQNGLREHEKYMTISVVTNPDRAKRLLWFKLPISDNCDSILDGDEY